MIGGIVMPDQEIDVEELDEDEDDVEVETTEGGLPLYVRLNPEHGAMWFDDISGLSVSQFNSTFEGKMIKEWARVPVKRDCSRIKDAIRRGILVPCDPSGQSRRLRNRRLLEYDSVEILMKRSQRELVAIINNINDADLLSKMLDYESKQQKKRRIALLTIIHERMKSRDVVGVTTVKATSNLLYDKKSGRLVNDVVGTNVPKR
jgi:hypothetical protein